MVPCDTLPWKKVIWPIGKATFDFVKLKMTHGQVNKN